MRNEKLIEDIEFLLLKHKYSDVHLDEDLARHSRSGQDLIVALDRAICELYDFELAYSKWGSGEYTLPCNIDPSIYIFQKIHTRLMMRKVLELALRYANLWVFS